MNTGEKNMKKSVFILMAFCVLLPCFALADVQSRVNAPEHVTETYRSAAGNITVLVDADVYAPNADRVPVYAIAPRGYTEDELQRMAKACFGGRPYTVPDGFERHEVTLGEKANVSSPSIRAYSLSYYNLEGMEDTYSLRGLLSVTKDGVIKAAQAHYEPLDEIGKSVFVPDTDEISMDGLPLIGCSVTQAEARVLADETVAAFAPDFACVGTAKDKGMLVFDSWNFEYYGTEAWAFYYTRALELPVTYCRDQSMDYVYIFVPPESIIVLVDDRGVFSVWYDHPHAITGIVEEDCELMPFDQIMRVVSAVLPMKYARLTEKYADIRILIDDVRLGYMRVMRMDAPGEFVWTPVWSFFGSTEYREGGDGEPIRNSSLYHSLLAVNAIDGMVINREIGY